MRWIIFLILVSTVLAYCESGTDSSISQFDITWTFDKEYECGQFVNGDYWVVGPVSIIKITPESVYNGRTMHGSMIDPYTATQGYDSYQYYDENLNVALRISSEDPLIIFGDKSLVSTISNDEPGTNQHVSYVKNAAVLTVLTRAPADGSFRPGISSAKTLHNINDVDFDLLQNLRYPFGLAKANLNSEAADLDMIWLAHNGGWTCRYMRPSGSGLDNYYYSQYFSKVALLLNLDYSIEEKRKLLINYMQLGIDLYSYLESGANGWAPDGGHSSGRKWPIIFTGIMLDYAPMKFIGDRSGEYLYSNDFGPGNAPSDYIHFGEDGQTFYVTQEDIDITNGPDWNPDRRNGDYSPYSQEMLGMPEWGIRYSTDPTRSDSSWSATYRTIGTGGRAWSGTTLAARIMDAKELWNNDALFDYVDRYMAISLGDSDPFEYTVSNEEPGALPDEFLVEMWEEYRDDYGCLGRGHDTQGNLQYSCVEITPPPPEGGFYYVKPGAHGNGSDWENALNELPDNLERGFTYYIADGSYPGYTFDDSGTAQIVVKKATTADHGTDIGWENSFGDGQAVFGPLVFYTDNIVIDGSHEYGFHVVGDFQGLVADVDGNDITIKNTDLDGNFQDTGGSHTGGSCNVMNIDGRNILIENCDIRNAADDGVGVYGDYITIRNSKVHQLHGCGTDGGCGPCYNGHSDGLELQDTSNILLEGNMIYDIKSTAAMITGQWSAGMYTRNLQMYNNILYTPDTGITAYLYYVHGAKIYNNVFWGRTQGSRYGGLAIGPEATNIDMKNNIILNINFAHLGGAFNPTEHHFENNLYAMVQSSEYTIDDSEIIGDPGFTNIIESSDMADHITSGLNKDDFMLSSGSPAIDAGLLNSFVPSVDMFNNIRDSLPDIGVHELDSCMTINDLHDIVNRWKRGEISIAQLIASIQAWKAGC